MENEIKEEPAAIDSPQGDLQIFNEDFMAISSTVVIVFTFAIINILSYMV